MAEKAFACCLRFAFAFAAAVTTVSRHELLTRRLATLLASTAPRAALHAPAAGR